MAQWEGKSKGTPLGYRIFMAILSGVGLYPAYFLLVFVAFYYLLFSWTTNEHSYSFFRTRCKYSVIRSALMIYWSYFMIGQSLIDKVAVMSGLSKKFTSTSNGSENITKMAEMKRGAIMIGAHLGNWEIAGHFIARYDTVVNILIFDNEHDQIKSYMDNITGSKKFKLIPIKPDLSHVYMMSEALMRGETICMDADRFLPGNRTIPLSFMGEEALFPIGPFQLVRALKAPYTFVYGVKTGSTHYDFYARTPREVKNFNDIRAMMTDYVSDLESMVRKCPGQWFNYYDFWAK
jgi:predicted LPLAT superfamily acyltransferase